MYHPAKQYDLVYTHVGINNLIDKGKGKNALPRFPSPSAAFSHLIGELAEMKRRIQPIAHGIVICETIGMDFNAYNDRRVVPQRDQTTINGAVLAVNRETHTLNNQGGFFTPRFERLVHRLTHQKQAHRYGATLADGLHYTHDTNMYFIDSGLDSIYVNIRAICN